MTKQEKFLDEALRQMFATVGRSYSPEATSKPNWYLNSTWTQDQENSFRDWLTRELMKKFHTRKKRAQFQASMFLLYYGWNIEEEPKQTAKQLRKELRRGERAIARGDTMTHEAAKRKMRKWLK